MARRDSSPQFPRSPLGTPVIMIPAVGTQALTKKQKKRLHFVSLAAKASTIKDPGWDTLEMKRRQFSLALMYKLTHGLIDIDSRELIFNSILRESHEEKSSI